MEQGKLNISKSKKGKTIVRIAFNDKKGKSKELTLQGANISEAESGKDIQFRRDEKGQVVEIVCEERVIFSNVKAQKREPMPTPFYKGKPSDFENQMQASHVENVQYPAHAPYNFIPLNEIAVEGEDIPNFDKYHEKRHTGWIGLRIEAKTPLYIRGTLTEQDL